ncbi:MAG: diacylglycerol O-acyltransferase, partial [Methanobacteriota archaeon]
FALLYVLFGLADNPDEIELPIGELPPLPGEEGANGTDDTDSRLPDASSPLERLSRGAKAAGSVLSSFPLSREPETPLRGRLTASKRVSWTRTFGLDDVKSAAHSHDGTLNDLLMAVTAGAFRRYTEERDTEVPQDLELTTAMPVNLKPLADRDEQLGNYFGLGFIDLPVGVRDIRRRVRAVQDRTGVLKQGTEARMTYSALDAVGAMPDSVQDVASTAFRGRVTAAITNVPGPLEPLEIAGTEVDDIIFWAPTTEDIGIGLSIFSYGGRVRIGVAVNENVVPEPDALADAFEEEMEEVLASTAANP